MARSVKVFMIPAARRVAGWEIQFGCGSLVTFQ